MRVAHIPSTTADRAFAPNLTAISLIDGTTAGPEPQESQRRVSRFGTQTLKGHHNEEVEPHTVPSATPAQLAGVIRYSLSQLKSQNAHHEFEHLCRHLAKARVYSNVLPATGPVGAGGDGGRDFETYRASGISSDSGGSSFFRCSSGDRKVAFACSLEDVIGGKIREDVRRILANGKFDEIVVFCEANIPVAKRHTLQAWARSEHDVDLQIFDGQAIAELLVARDTFWIAQEYLRIPAELAPMSVDEPGWYREALERWRSTEPIPVSHAHFVEIKWGLRHAALHADARASLPLWLTLMEGYLTAASPRYLQRSAVYEISVASWRGKREMGSQIERLRDFFLDLEDWLSLGELRDAVTLCTYVFGVWARGELDIQPAEFLGWRERLADRLDQQIVAAPGPGRRSGLLDIRGFLCCTPLAIGESAPTEDAFDFWYRMLDDAELAPLFPVEQFSDFLTAAAAALSADPRFRGLVERVDSLVAKRAGPAVAAAKMFDRALFFYQTDDLVSAIHDLQGARRGWFSGDSMAHFQRAMLLLSKCYLELHLSYAAKYYALTAAYIARYADDDEVRHFLPTLLFAAADADDGSGNSLSFMRLLLLAVAAHFQLERDPLDSSQHPEFQTNLGQVAALRGIAARAGPGLLAIVDEGLRLWPEPLRESIIRSSNEAGFWTQGSWDDIWKIIQESSLGKPFSDLGSTRSIEWRGLGIHWSVMFENTYETACLSEQFVAQLQTAIGTLAGVDLALLPTRLDLRLRVSTRDSKITIADLSETQRNEGYHLAVTLPGGGPRHQQEQVQSVSWVLELLLRCSVLPEQDLLAILRDRAPAVMTTMHAGRPYGELYCEFIPPELFPANERRSEASFMAERRFHPHEHPGLAWKGGPGPMYSAEISAESIRGRYRRGAKCVGITAKRLMNSTPTRRRLEHLHEAVGMKDWEILSVILNIALNIRMPIADPQLTPEHIDRFRALMDVTERDDSALAPELFTEELIKEGSHAFLGAFASGWGLGLSGNVDMKALEEFLIRRYNLRTDDQEHPDMFGWSACKSELTGRIRGD